MHLLDGGKCSNITKTHYKILHFPAMHRFMKTIITNTDTWISWVWLQLWCLIKFHLCVFGQPYLIHRSLMARVCFCKLCNIWSIWWFVTFSSSSFYLHHYWFVVDWTVENKFEWNLNHKENYFHARKCIWKRHLQAGPYFDSVRVRRIKSNGDSAPNYWVLP